MTTDSPNADSRDVLAEIERLAREKVGWSGRLERSMRLVEDLQLDSIRNLTLAIEIENHFRIAIGQEDEGDLETVGDLVDLVQRELDAVGPEP
ncbi:MAG: acyl carrier protein [Acidobacteriota bacterium]|nr:acyl carrier protein [Acidobacteriota bacterium]